VCAKFARENGLAFSPEQITAGTGAKQVIYNAFMCTLDPGDEIIVPAPHYTAYGDVASICGAVSVSVPCLEANGFKLQPAELERAITPRTRWLVLTSPSNPTGAAYTREELQALAAVLARHPHVWVLCDDIYEHLLYDGRTFATMAQAAPALADRTLTVNGVSKAYAMTGWRIGYGAGPVALINSMRKMQSQSTSCPSSVSQAAAVAALTGPQEFLALRADDFQQRRDATVRALNAVPGLSCRVPEGAFYAYPSCAGLIGARKPDGGTIASDQDFALYLLEAAGVAVVQGDAYGLSPYFRVSYATSMALLEDGLGRIQRACAALERQR
jgi:aspartate aminotransferase